VARPDFRWWERRVARKSELVVVGGKKPHKRPAGKHDWTRDKERTFVSVLGDTCNVTCACAEAGVSVSSAYERRKKNAPFRAAWLEAIAVAYQRLELVLLERAFNGTDKVVRRKDGSEERMREYSDRLGLALLKAHRDTAVSAAPETGPDNIDEIRERLFNKLERLRKREEAPCTAG
jgi:hypothetical protein